MTRYPAILSGMQHLRISTKKSASCCIAPLQHLLTRYKDLSRCRTNTRRDAPRRTKPPPLRVWPLCDPSLSLRSHDPPRCGCTTTARKGHALCAFTILHTPRRYGILHHQCFRRVTSYTDPSAVYPRPPSHFLYCMWITVRVP